MVTFHVIIQVIIIDNIQLLIKTITRFISGGGEIATSLQVQAN